MSLKTSKTGVSPAATSPTKHAVGSGAERRARCRAKLVGKVHIRGGIGTRDAFEDVGNSIDVTRDGLLVATSRGGYWVGQIIDVTYPYWTSPTAINQARRARVVRNLLMPDFSYAVAVHFEVREVDDTASQPPVNLPSHVRVLGVESDPSMARAMRDLLEQDGYQVLFVSTAQQALHILQNDIPHVLLADAAGRGELSGRELCAMIKKDLRLKHIPVILLTHSALPSDYSASYRAGAVVCMMKPCDPERLQHAVHLVAPPPGHRSAYSAGFNSSSFVRTS
jgi:CheY-like chemotaxis protein